SAQVRADHWRDGRFTSVTIRATLLPARYGQGDVRHGHERVAQHWKNSPRIEKGRGHRAGVGLARATDLRLRGHHQFLRRHDRVAEEPAWFDSKHCRSGGAGDERRGQWWGLSRA